MYWRSGYFIIRKINSGTPTQAFFNCINRPMSKEFEAWSNKKSVLHNEGLIEFYHEREVWWCSLGINIGDEQDGTGKNFDRPIIIVKGFNKHLFFGAALTGKKKVGQYYFYLGEIEGRDATAILSQVRILDTKRLMKKICTLEKDMFLELKSSLRKTLFD